jgi:hypothetical protein
MQREGPRAVAGWRGRTFPGPEGRNVTYMPRAAEEEITSAASVLRGPDPVESAYRLLDDVATRHGCEDAWLVLHPPGRAPQLFRLGRRTITAADVPELAARPTGLYSEPPVEAALGAALGALGEAAFALHAAAFEACVDEPSGLASRRTIDVSLDRAAARAARHRWSTTAVLVTTTGPGEEGRRWQALGAAMRNALRSGDEAGVAWPGTAIALLGNADTDAVRPFLARVRAELSGSGWSGVDLLAATATTPQESVDPSELWRLATERLVELGAGEPAHAGASLELELRLLPSVAFVDTERQRDQGKLTVVRVPPEAGAAEIVAAVHRYDPGLSVDVVTAEVSAAETPSAQMASAKTIPAGTTVGETIGAGTGATETAPARVPATQTLYAQATALLDVVPLPNIEAPAHTNGTNGHHPAEDEAEGPPSGGSAPLLSATVPGGGGDPAGFSRVTLVGATFDPARGVCEVTLSHGAARGTGRAPAGPLGGGAQATLFALGALGVAIPFYLVSAERLQSVPGAPVVVVLAPRGGESAAAGSGERIGVAAAASDVEAASRAALGALNRYLAGPPA